MLGIRRRWLRRRDRDDDASAEPRESLDKPEYVGESFLERTNYRTLPDDYAGDVLLWDIDKTYLDTRFSSWRGLVAIPFDFAIDKTPVAGAVPLLRGLRRGQGEVSALTPLYFLSGSPLQLRSVIERRMTLDGVDFDGITFKDQLGLLMHGRARDIREQVGFKLTALLLYLQEVPSSARWLLFGDDVERDADVFVLFGEVCAGLRGSELLARLQSLGASPAYYSKILALADRLPIVANPVQRIFIILAKPDAPLGQALMNDRIVAARSYLQTAMVLYDMQRLQAEHLERVIDDMQAKGFTQETLKAHADDAQGRFGLSAEVVARVARYLD